MARIVYSAAALDDLERIVDFLAEAVSADAALVAIEQIRTAVAVLAKHPRIGRRTSSGYLALYRLSRPEVVRILRIRHQRDAGYRD